MYRVYDAINKIKGESYLHELINKTKIDKKEIEFYLRVLEHLGFVAVLESGKEYNPIIKIL